MEESIRDRTVEDVAVIAAKRVINNLHLNHLIIHCRVTLLRKYHCNLLQIANLRKIHRILFLSCHRLRIKIVVLISTPRTYD